MKHFRNQHGPNETFVSLAEFVDFRKGEDLDASLGAEVRRVTTESLCFLVSRKGTILRLCLMFLMIQLMAARCKADSSVPNFHYFDSNDVKVVAKSIEQYGIYDSDRQRFDVGTVRPAYSFNGTVDQGVTSNPYSFGKLVFKDKVGGTHEYTADVYLFPGKGDLDYFNKPLIVSDGLDPYNERGAWQIYSEDRYKRLLSMEKPFYPRSMGYDIYFVNFNQGGGDILINASLFLELVEWMHTRTNANMIIGGPSMSGIVSRLALLFALPNNHTCKSGQNCGYLTPNVSGYLSIDSPHQGASLDPKFQCAVREVWGYLKHGCEKALGFCKDAMCGAVNQAKSSYFNLRTPATYQMLYSHSYANDDYQREGCYANATGHDDFYAFMDRLAVGGYSPYVPKVAIAYSNFYAPYDDEQAKKAALDENVTYGHIDLKFQDTVCSDWDNDLPYNAGGSPLSSEPLNPPGFHELAPGSVSGRFYYSPYDREAVASYDDNNKKTMEMRNYVVAGETYKGTHIPIYSALDLDLPPNLDWRNLPITDRNELVKYSPFEAIYWMTDQYNGYAPNQTTADDKRYEHIIYDDQLMTALAEGLRFLETSPCVLPKQGDWEIIRSCALPADHRAPRNITIKEGATMTIPNGRSLDFDFANYRLRIMPGGKLIIQPGGRIY